MDITSFIENIQYNQGAVIQLLGVYILVLWVAVLVWVAKDITTRSKNLLVIAINFLLVALGTFPGLVLYLLIRPDRTIEDDENKNLFYSSIIDKEVSQCPECNHLVRTEYKFCPICSHNLDYKCPECKIEINPVWNFCASCNANLIPEPSYMKYLGSAKKYYKKALKSTTKIGNKAKVVLNPKNYIKIEVEEIDNEKKFQVRFFNPLAKIETKTTSVAASKDNVVAKKTEKVKVSEKKHKKSAQKKHSQKNSKKK